MAKTITFEFDGIEYNLEFTRKTVELMERQGFVPRDITTRPLSTLPALFAGAFLAHHRNVKKDKIDQIFSRLTNKDQLLEKLAEMFNEPLEAFMDDPEDSEGNVSWGASW